MCNTGKKTKMSPTLENSVSMSPTLPVPSSNVDCSEKSDKCSVIELDMSREEEESEREESDEEYEVDETIPTSTIQRQSKRLRTGNSVIKIENLREGNVKCPVCEEIICVANRGCNIITCLNHRPHFDYFCIHCKNVNENGVEYGTCQCEARNTVETRMAALARRNEDARENPIEIDLSDDDM